MIMKQLTERYTAAGKQLYNTFKNAQVLDSRGLIQAHEQVSKR